MVCNLLRVRDLKMRPTTLIALSALLGLTACDASKMNAPLGAKPGVASIGSCPATPAPACPPAQGVTPVIAKPMTMEPEGSGPTAGSPNSTVRQAAWITPAKSHRIVRHVRKVVDRKALPARVHRNVYAGGYTGERVTSPEDTSPDYAERRTYERHYETPRVYVAPEVIYEHQGYAEREARPMPPRYEYHLPSPPPAAPYVAPRRETYAETRHYEQPAPPPRVIERRVYREVAPTYHYESRDQVNPPIMHRYVEPPRRPVVVDDDCRCETQAAGRDRQGFLTWPGKR